MYFAIRIKWSNWGVGIVIDFDDLWLTIRLGPLHFDASGGRPDWGGVDWIFEFKFEVDR